MDSNITERKIAYLEMDLQTEIRQFQEKVIASQLDLAERISSLIEQKDERDAEEKQVLISTMIQENKKNKMKLESDHELRVKLIKEEIEYVKGE